MVTINEPMQAGNQGLITSNPAGHRSIFTVNAEISQVEHPGDRLLVPENLSGPARRLVVLVPTGEVDEQALARRVWQLASPSSLDVLYLALSPDPVQVATQRRRLAGMAAWSAYPHLRTEIDVRAEKDWYQTLKQVLQTGDLLVRPAEESEFGWLSRQGTSKQLVSTLNVPVYELGDVIVTHSQTPRRWSDAIFGWTITLVSLVAVYWLSLRIDRSSIRLQSTILLCLPVLVDFLILWKINHWTG